MHIITTNVIHCMKIKRMTLNQQDTVEKYVCIKDL